MKERKGGGRGEEYESDKDMFILKAVKGLISNISSYFFLFLSHKPVGLLSLAKIWQGSDSRRSEWQARAKVNSLVSVRGIDT